MDEKMDFEKMLKHYKDHSVCDALYKFNDVMILNSIDYYSARMFDIVKVSTALQYGISHHKYQVKKLTDARIDIKVVLIDMFGQHNEEPCSFVAVAMWLNYRNYSFCKWDMKSVFHSNIILPQEIERSLIELYDLEDVTRLELPRLKMEDVIYSV